MMYILDFIVVAAVQQAIDRLRNNIDELEFLLEKYRCVAPVAKIVGDSYIKQLMDVILNTEGKNLNITTHYNLDKATNYDLYVLGAGSESTQFLGDLAPSDVFEVSPRLYLIADAVKIKDSKTLVFLKSTCACDLLFPGLQAFLTTKDCVFSAKVVSVIINSDSLVEVELDTDLPKNGSAYRLNGWKFYSPHNGLDVTVHSSGDNFNVSMLLRTAGDLELHKLFAMIVRYALKSQRSFLTDNGLQVSKMSQGLPSEDNSGQDIYFVSNFSLSGTAFDYWVDTKTERPDRINLVLSAYDGPDTEEVTILEE